MIHTWNKYVQYVNSNQKNVLEMIETCRENVFLYIYSE